MSDEKTTERASVEGFESPINLKYSFAAGRATSKFLKEIKQGRIVGQRSPKTGLVIVPPRGSDPQTGVATEEEVILPDTGTVISFTICHLPIPNNPIMPPFIIANLVLDGSDQTFIHLVSECKNEDIQIGTRLKAKWKDSSEWGLSMDNIQYFVPMDEAPIDIGELKQKRLKETEKYRHA